MTDIFNNNRKDTASKIIKASPQKIYEALTSPEAIAEWKPPGDMTCKIYEFNPQEGGTYRMAFVYSEKDDQVRGKTSEHEDAFTGRFLELTPNKRIVEVVEFESDDPAFAGEMKMTTTLTPVPGGTEVAFLAENVPAGIKPEDHKEGMESSLNHLAEFTA